MSMTYFIYSDVDSDKFKAFPDGLNYFFEQYFGYEKYSLVAQTAKILNIDLDIFQQISDPESEENVWHEITTLKNIVSSFINKINSTPDFFEQVEYVGVGDSTSSQDKFMKFAQSKDVDKMMAFLKQMQNKPNANFPPNNGYLESGNLLTDLVALEQILHDLEILGTKKIKLIYM